MIARDRLAAIEANAVALGVSRVRLQEASGRAVAREIGGHTADGAAVEIVAGRGKTGGIGFAAARYLPDHDVTVSLLGQPSTITSSTARENWEVLVEADCDRQTVGVPEALEFDDATLVVDAVCGADFAGDLADLDRAAVARIDDSDATTLSVDVPSGWDADAGGSGDTPKSGDARESAGPSVSADHVVTFHRPTHGLDSHLDVTVADVGIPRAAERFVGPGEVRQFRDRLRAGKREGDTGRVFVVGGGPYTGAPAISAQAALRAGADLSFLAVPDAVSDPIQSYTENLIVQPYEGESLAPDHVESLVERAQKYDDVVVLGPGLGDEPETLQAVQAFLDDYDGRVVVDADAIPVVADVDTAATLVLTPNEDELAELGGPDVDGLRAGATAIESFASDLGHTLLVKGRDAVVTDGEETRIARGGTTGMTVGGTGDVLAGVVAAFLGVASPLEAACGAAFVKERSGRRLSAQQGAGFLATDLLEAVPSAIWPSGQSERR